MRSQHNHKDLFIDMTLLKLGRQCLGVGIEMRFVPLLYSLLSFYYNQEPFSLKQTKKSIAKPLLEIFTLNFNLKWGAVRIKQSASVGH